MQLCWGKATVLSMISVEAPVNIAETSQKTPAPPEHETSAVALSRKDSLVSGLRKPISEPRNRIVYSF